MEFCHYHGKVGTLILFIQITSIKRIFSLFCLGNCMGRICYLLYVCYLLLYIIISVVNCTTTLIGKFVSQKSLGCHERASIDLC